MKDQKLATLRFLALLFLFPGLAGLIISASISTHYVNTLPKEPVPAEMRMTPRNIHGSVVFQTKAEDRFLSSIEDTSVGVFFIGLTVGLVYVRRWGLEQAIAAEEEEYSSAKSA
jgi:hypothetical protein